MKNSSRIVWGLSLGSLLAACGPSEGDSLPESKVVESTEARLELPNPEFELPGTNAPGTTEMALYLHAHKVAADPQAEDWPQALETLERLGDGFSLEKLAVLDRRVLSESQLKGLDRTLKSLREREASASDSGLEDLLTSLERSAYADLTCHELETSLPQWAIQRARDRVNEPKVREALERMKAGELSRRLPESGFRTTFERRLGKYAGRILEP